MVHGSIQAGGQGVSIGRNIFQNKNVEAIVRAISKIVHENATVEEALSLL
jgi:DhnA family fructose-bisphosphate aldolase class Ia